MIEQKDWKWFGRAVHYICGHKCRFHLATLVGKYLISTVGEKIPNHLSNDYELYKWMADNWPGEDIGSGRKYETMVFEAGEICNRSECMCGVPETSGHELEAKFYNLAGDAAAGHLELCNKWASKE